MHKATGAEIRAFYETGLPDGFDWKETSIQLYEMSWAGEKIVSTFLLDPKQTYNLRDLGTFRPSDTSAFYFDITFEEAFVTWKKRQRNLATAAIVLETTVPAPQPEPVPAGAQTTLGPEDFHHPHAA